MTVPAPGQDNPQETPRFEATLVGGVTVGALKQYAEQSKKWNHGERSEDQLLQRIWNLADDSLAFVAALEAATRERDALAARLRDAPLGGNGSHWEGCWRSHIDCATARVKDAELALEAARDALRQIVMAEPNETGSGTAWPSFAGSLQSIAASALEASASTENKT